MTERRSLAGVRSLRWWSLLLVPGGFVAGHELGYAAASLLGATPGAAGHGYLAVVVVVGVPFACAAAIRAFLAGLRAEVPPVGWPALASAQVTLFVAVELAEHGATDQPWSRNHRLSSPEIVGLAKAANPDPVPGR